MGIASLALTLIPLVIGWQWAASYQLLLCVAAFLGLAGASFAVALPLASRWYPPHLQGLALGIAGPGTAAPYWPRWLLLSWRGPTVHMPSLAC